MSQSAYFFATILQLFHNQFTSRLQLFYCWLTDFTINLQLFLSYFHNYLDRTGRAGRGERVGSGAGSGRSQVGGLARRVVGYGYCTVISQIVSVILQQISVLQLFYN